VKVAIVGPREIEDYNILLEAVNKSGFKITEVVSGGAKGVDSLAEDYANDNELECTVFKPDWNNINRPGKAIK
jgi:predicted Rossmann fold nucleotide-binding protein DprA/Smf involved in DNA uptake